ncbi:hypothetical protein TNCV_2189971 [Trichonephila clavipes]|nr:hypothetical protein TNCV_2189971 [Trichonephila clavipes]
MVRDEDIWAGRPSLTYTTPTGGRLSSGRFNVHQLLSGGESSVTLRLKLMTREPRASTIGRGTDIVIKDNRSQLEMPFVLFLQFMF